MRSSWAEKQKRHLVDLDIADFETEGFCFFFSTLWFKNAYKTEILHDLSWYILLFLIGLCRDEKFPFQNQRKTSFLQWLFLELRLWNKLFRKTPYSDMLWAYAIQRHHCLFKGNEVRLNSCEESTSYRRY